MLSLTIFFSSLFSDLVMLAGLGELQSELVENWIGPAYLIAVAFFAIKFLKDREFRTLFIFIAIAIIVGLLIFFADDLFGSGGSITKSAKGVVDKVNTIVLPSFISKLNLALPI